MDRARVPEPVDIREGIESTVALLRDKASSKGAAITLSLEPDLPTIDAYASELIEVWSNLIDNALDAIPSGGKVEVIATRDIRGAAVSIIDNGPGIPASLRDRIYDPFFTTKKPGAGTGLGLNIARRLVQNHNGQIDLASRPGRTEFTVRIPCSPDSAQKS
jgi:signal transduction histidine kinase